MNRVSWMENALSGSLQHRTPNVRSRAGCRKLSTEFWELCARHFTVGLVFFPEAGEQFFFLKNDPDADINGGKQDTQPTDEPVGRDERGGAEDHQ